MSKPNGRRVRLSQFKQQLAEAVLPPDGKVVIELDDDGEDTVTFVVPMGMGADDGDGEDEYLKAIQASQGPDELATVVLGAEQLERWLAAGNTAAEFAVLFSEENRAAQERMRDFRYKRSGK